MTEVAGLSMTPTDVAEALHVSRNTVHRLLIKGPPDGLAGFRVGNRWRILRRELDRYIDDQLAAAAARYGR